MQNIQNLPQVQAAHQLAAKLTQQAQSGSTSSAAVTPSVNVAALQAAALQQAAAANNPILAAAKFAAGQIAAKVTN